MKTILVPMEGHVVVQSALETALLLARRCDSYIEGFALRWAINEFMVGDVMGGMPLETYRQDTAEEAKKARQIFVAVTVGWMRRQRVKVSLAATAGFST